MSPILLTRSMRIIPGLPAALLLLATVAGAASAPAQPAPSPRPNILLIAVDDLNVWVHHIGRNRQAITPNIDRLAERGVSFVNAHAASSVCNPSRTAMLTGLRPSTSGVYGNTTDWRTVIGDGYSLPGWLRRNGYHTFGVGKLFHTPEQIRAGDWDEYPHNPNDEALDQVENSNANTSHAMAGAETAGNMLIVPLAGGDDQVSDYWNVTQAVEALQRKHEQPTFIACGIFRPHLPWRVPKKYFDLYPEDQIELPPYKEDDLADIPGSQPTGEHLKILREGSWKKAIRAYLACITYADAQVGRLLDALAASGNAGNTVVILLGDHGWHLGEKQKWRKTGLWEEATHTPYIWVAPGVTSPGGRSLHAVDLMSLYPTLAELTGIPKPSHVEGVSIASLLRNPAAPWTAAPALTTWQFGNHTVRTDRWRYLRWNNGREELYDHDADPYEWFNLLHPSNAARAPGTDVPAIKARLLADLPKTNRSTEEGTATFNHPAAPAAH